MIHPHPSAISRSCDFGVLREYSLSPSLFCAVSEICLLPTKDFDCPYVVQQLINVQLYICVIALDVYSEVELVDLFTVVVSGVLQTYVFSLQHLLTSRKDFYERNLVGSRPVFSCRL